jgi:hypothetical protein
LSRALERLTGQGTLTQQQAQAVRDAVRDEVKQGRQSRKDRRGELRTIRREGLKVAAGTIGISEDDLLKELKSGKSIAQVAQEHNVDRQRVVDALNTFGRQKIDEAQAKGTIDEQQAARLRERLPDLVNRLVDRQCQSLTALLSGSRFVGDPISPLAALSSPLAFPAGRPDSPRLECRAAGARMGTVRVRSLGRIKGVDSWQFRAFLPRAPIVRVGAARAAIRPRVRPTTPPRRGSRTVGPGGRCRLRWRCCWRFRLLPAADLPLP